MTLFGLLSYETKNLGDDIQSLAAKQFLPRVDMRIDRDKIAEIELPEPTKIIMNGWFKRNPKSWPIKSKNIIPLFVSFHISNEMGSSHEYLLSDEAIAYYKKHEPIGCRDMQTMNLLKERGVDAYFSGCMTLTLKNIWNEPRTDEIIFVHIPLKYLRVIPKKILFIAKYVSQYLHFPWFHRNREKEALKLLRRYSRAKLVVTSRLHVALPCIALNTPVIFTNERKNDPRFIGFENILPFITPEELKSYDWSNPKFSAPNISEIVEKLESRCKEFIGAGLK